MKHYSAIILSAGYSSRMGSFKPLMDLAGKSPLQRCIDLFYNCGLEEIIVVTGYRTERIQEKIWSDTVKIIKNENYSQGMYSSVKAGIGALSKNTDAFFILPVDIPSVTENSVRKLMTRFENIKEGIIFPTFFGERGHPTLISYSYAPEISNADPEGGLRDILQKHKEAWYYEPLTDRGILLDMDTEEDFRILLEYIQNAPVPQPSCKGSKFL